MKRVLGLIIMVVVMFSSLAQAADLAEVEQAFKDGKFGGTVGLYQRYRSTDDNRGTAEADTGWGHAFAELKYKSAPYQNISLGTKILGLAQLYEDDTEWDSLYLDDAVVKDFYLQYDLEDTYLKAGRFKIKKSPVMDGDSHAGLEIGTKAIERLDISFSIISEWINDAAWDEDGIDKFGGVSLARRDVAGKYVTSLMVGIDAIPDFLKLTPYVHVQDDYNQIYGIDTKLSKTIQDIKLGLDLGYYTIKEDGDSTVFTDAEANRIYLSGEYSDIGLGFGYSEYDLDDMTKISARGDWVDDFGGIKEDANGYATDDNRVTTWADISYKFDPFKASLSYGIQDDEGADDLDYDETNLIVSYKMAKNMKLEMRYAHGNYNNNNGNNFDLFDTRLSYKF